MIERTKLRAELKQAKLDQCKAMGRGNVKAMLKASKEVDRIVKALGWSE